MALYNLVVNYNIIKVKISKFTHDYTDISFDIIGDENSLNQIYIALNTHPTDDSIYMCMYDKRFLVEVINKNETILSIRLTNISVQATELKFLTSVINFTLVNFIGFTY